MKTKIYNLDEAMNFFLSNHNDTCICVKNGKEKECKCYPDAVKFFE